MSVDISTRAATEAEGHTLARGEALSAISRRAVGCSRSISGKSRERPGLLLERSVGRDYDLRVPHVENILLEQGRAKVVMDQRAEVPK